MKTEKAIERIKAFRDYLCAGNPIWDVEECKEAFDIAIAAMEQRWIPVSERLPKPDEEVFVYLWGNVPHLASVNSEGQWETDQFYLDADDTPKAWMPLPGAVERRRE